MPPIIACVDFQNSVGHRQGCLRLHLIDLRMLQRYFPVMIFENCEQISAWANAELGLAALMLSCWVSNLDKDLCDALWFQLLAMQDLITIQ